MLANPAAESGASLAIVFALYSFQLYFDFLGYSTIAVGLARLFGVSLAINFDRPYAASSLKEFWRRWHISLSSWFRDYVYRPLGGRDATGLRRISVVVAVFLMSGLWHGATPNFLAWGTFHGIAYLLEDGARKRFGRTEIVAGRDARVCVTFAIVTFGWIFFRLSDQAHIRIVIERIIRLDSQVPYFTLNPVLFAPASMVACALAGTALLLDMWPKLPVNLPEQPRSSSQMVAELAVVNLLLVALVLFGDQGAQGFVYFSF